MNNKNCQLCKNYKDGYCEELELKPSCPEKGCDYFSRKNRIEIDTMQGLESYISFNGVGFPDVKAANEYKRGWCDALSMALKEAYTIHFEEGIFQVIQAETLIGLGYAIDEFGAGGVRT